MASLEEAMGISSLPPSYPPKLGGKEGKLHSEVGSALAGSLCEAEQDHTSPPPYSLISPHHCLAGSGVGMEVAGPGGMVACRVPRLSEGLCVLMLCAPRLGTS